MFGQLNGQIAQLFVGPLAGFAVVVQNVVQIGLNIAINVGPIS